MAKAIVASHFYDVTTNQTSNIDDFEYDINQIGVRTNIDGNQVAMFHVKEYRRDAPTQGGASFKITVRGEHTRASCSYKDLFNGSYLVCCVLREYRNVIWITLKNVNFLAYRLFYSHNRVIGKFTVLSSRPNVDRYGKLIPEDEFLRYEGPTRNRIACYRDPEYWLKNADHDWRYVRNNKLLKHMTRTKVNECIDNKYNGQLIVNGDSHIRFEYFYINMKIRGFKKGPEYQKIKNVKTDFLVVIQNSSFHMSTYEYWFLKHLTWFHMNHPQTIKHMYETNNYSSYENNEPYFVEPVSDERKALLLLDSGTWDLAFNNSAVYISNFYNIKEMLGKLKEQNNYEMIWQNIPAWGQLMEHNGYRHTNTYVNAALNAWQASQLRTLGIPIINFWKMSLPFQDCCVDPCSCHYLCQHDGKWIGYPGAEAAYDFLLTMCS